MGSLYSSVDSILSNAVNSLEQCGNDVGILKIRAILTVIRASIAENNANGIDRLVSEAFRISEDAMSRLS